MSQVVLIDSGVLGLISNPRRNAAAEDCLRWLDLLAAAENVVRVPAIADYEVRRELLRAGKGKGIVRLNEIVIRLGYLPMSKTGFLLAAELWAEARRQGRPTAADSELDGDVILAAQAKEAELEYDLPVIVATTNVAHLSRYVDARRWQDILPSQPTA